MKRLLWTVGLALAVGCAPSDTTSPSAPPPGDNSTAAVETTPSDETGTALVSTATRTITLSVPGMT